MMFLEVVHILVKKVNSIQRPAPGRLVIVGLLLLMFVAILAACGNGVEVATSTPPGQVTPPVEVTRVIVITPDQEPPREVTPPVTRVLLGRPLDSQEQEAFGDLIDNRELMITAARVALTSSHGITLTYSQPVQKESFLIPDSNNGRTMLGRLNLQELADYGLIGAVTKRAEPHEDPEGEIIGILEVNDEIARDPFEGGTYLVVVLADSGSPPTVVLIHESGEEVPGENVIERPREDFGLNGGGSAFLFTIGSHRCHICPWFLNHCICFNCPHW